MKKYGVYIFVRIKSEYEGYIAKSIFSTQSTDWKSELSMKGST